nr:PREDICTED: LOW QUALITY PROTEIN: uncharacterized protein LOC105662954 [Megachile rotundata]
MLGADKNTLEKEKRQAVRRQQEESRKIRFKSMMEVQEAVELQSSPSSGTEYIEHAADISCAPEFLGEPGPSEAKKRRGKTQVITEKLVAVLDNCKISDRDAVRVIMATAEALNHDLNELVINRSSIQRCRHRLRAERTIKLREAFEQNLPSTVTVHWDGKMLPSGINAENVERLPIIITYGKKEKLLGVPAIPNSSGKEQALAIYGLLEDWNLIDRVQALCCDTTSSNTGRLQGACVLLEQLIERIHILYLPCRHHIYELILRSVQDPYVYGKLQDVKEKINFCLYHLRQKQPRDDYKEFLELIIIFLGGSLPRGNTFHVPGAFHHARWMAKLTYTFKPG